MDVAPLPDAYLGGIESVAWTSRVPRLQLLRHPGVVMVDGGGGRDRCSHAVPSIVMASGTPHF
jgi:hypothetical protein